MVAGGSRWCTLMAWLSTIKALASSASPSSTVTTDLVWLNCRLYHITFSWLAPLHIIKRGLGFSWSFFFCQGERPVYELAFHVSYSLVFAPRLLLPSAHATFASHPPFYVGPRLFCKQASTSCFQTLIKKFGRSESFSLWGQVLRYHSF